MINEKQSNGEHMSMRQGSPGGRRPRGRHGSNGDNRNNGGGQGPMRGGDRDRPRSAASLRHQTFDSNGPDVRVRGNAWQVCEKYQSLARDAQSSGDRVLAENYLQHAEHYYRLTEAIEEATASEQRQRSASFAPQQPEVPSNYYTPDGQLMGSPVAPQTGAQPQPALPSQPAPGFEAAPQEPAQAEVRRRTPPPSSTLAPLFPPEETDDHDHDPGPQQLVAGR